MAMAEFSPTFVKVEEKKEGVIIGKYNNRYHAELFETHYGKYIKTKEVLMGIIDIYETPFEELANKAKMLFEYDGPVYFAFEDFQDDENIL